jgi:hypothetical protein
MFSIMKRINPRVNRKNTLFWPSQSFFRVMRAENLMNRYSGGWLTGIAILPDNPFDTAPGLSDTMGRGDFNVID